jgi:hypothetical protein
MLGCGRENVRLEMLQQSYPTYPASGREPPTPELRLGRTHHRDRIALHDLVSLLRVLQRAKLVVFHCATTLHSRRCRSVNSMQLLAQIPDFAS